jgi:hypothetical protein
MRLPRESLICLCTSLCLAGFSCEKGQLYVGAQDGGAGTGGSGLAGSAGAGGTVGSTDAAVEGVVDARVDGAADARETGVGAGADAGGAAEEVAAAGDGGAPDGPTDGSVADGPADAPAGGPTDTSAGGSSDTSAGDSADTSADSQTVIFVGTFGSGKNASLTFEAAVGQSVAIRAVATDSTGFEVGLAVNDPGGKNLGTASGRDVAAVTFRAQTTGTYTMSVFGSLSATQPVGGTFTLYLVVAPGTDEGGALAPGGMVAAHLDEGALASYTFVAEAGQGIALRMADVGGSSLAPGITVYDPTGAVVASANANFVAAVAFQAQSNGTYTVVLGDSSGDLTGTGDYNLSFTMAPGANKGGALVPGGMVAAHLDQGALASYTFAADAGQGIMLRMADVAGGSLEPGITVYDPTGAVVGRANASFVAAVAFQAHSNGTYTVVLGDSSAGLTGTGDYNLSFTKAPGANKGGALAPGGMVAAHLEEGALDSYTFAADASQGFMLRMADAVGGALAPGITVYDPTGAVVTSAMANKVASVSSWGQSNGTYTVVLWDASNGLAAAGDYDLYFTIAPGAASNGTLDSHGAIAHINEGALDSYVFDANVGDAIAIGITSVSSGSLDPALIVYDPTGAVVAVGTMSSSVSFQALSTGTYTVVVFDSSPDLAGTGDCDIAFSLSQGS